MPLYKFKTLKEAEQAQWNTPPDKNYFEQREDFEPQHALKKRKNRAPED